MRGLAIKLVVAAVQLDRSDRSTPRTRGSSRSRSTRCRSRPPGRRRPSFGRDQLQRLAAFLKEQPAIRLRLRPVTTVADVTALRREALDARLAAAGADPAARRQAAVAIYAELFPRRQPPPTDEALLEELIRRRRRRRRARCARWSTDRARRPSATRSSRAASPPSAWSRPRRAPRSRARAMPAWSSKSSR